jgi:hypothetical protein
VENAELEVALEELESRLERLRALYEQYFMGIERIEPAIPRKDVDRRIYVLRREKIRNTAKRFKLQTIISRYNTFQQYWQRICREIEQGTYKRHLIKAERIAPGKMLTIAARKRMGRAALQAMEEGAEAAPTSTEPASLPPAAPSAPPPPTPAAVPASATPRLAPPPRPVPPPKPGVRPPKPTSVPPLAAAAAPAALAAKPAVAAPAPAARAPFESLDLDMDFLGDWDPSAAPSKPGAKRVPEFPARPFGKPLSRPMSTPPSPPTASNGLKAPPLAPARPATPPLAPLRAAPLRPAVAAAKPALPSAPSAPSALPPRPGAPAAPPARPAAAPGSAMAARPAPPPPAAKPLAAPIPGASPPKPVPPKPAVPAPAAAATPHDDRVRELHARLVEAKRQTQDATTVSMEGLAKSMKATEAKLREQHKNRKIDFDVVIKDGKAVLKPIVR